MGGDRRLHPADQPVKASAICLAVLAAGCAGPRLTAPAPGHHLVDLTHTLSPAFPYIPVQNKTFPFRINPIATLAADGVAANRWELTEHVGTHLDAPNHFAAGGASVDELPLSSLIVPARRATRTRSCNSRRWRTGKPCMAASPTAPASSCSRAGPPARACSAHS